MHVCQWTENRLSGSGVPTAGREKLAIWAEFD